MKKEAQRIPKKLSDYIFLYYGHKCVYVWEGERGKILQGTVTPNIIHLRTIIACKLILRNLADMTGVEKKELLSIMHGMSSVNLLPDIKAGHLINLFINERDPEIIRWLISKGFDIFKLIEAGLAIDEKSLSNYFESITTEEFIKSANNL